MVIQIPDSMKPITDQKPPRRVFQIVDTVPPDKRDPLTLLDPDGIALACDHSPRVLADRAFDAGADDVRHAYDLVAFEASR